MLKPTALLFSFAMLCCAQAHAAGPVGDWHGELQAGPAKLPLAVTILDGEQGMNGSVASPQQGPQLARLDAIQGDAAHLSFKAPQIGASYQGRWDGAAWVGEWTQSGRALPLILKSGALPARPTVAGLDGEWRGALTANGGSLRLVLRVHSGRFGSYALWDSPDQLANGMPASRLTRVGQSVRADLDMVGASFTGTLSADGSAIDGHWKQGAGVVPIRLVRHNAPGKPLARPQHPRPPFPYAARNVVYPSKDGSFKLAGTLTVPAGAGPHPAVLLITGSGSQDRDQTLFGHKPFLVIADALTRRGYAVLRVDDRGVGGSGGSTTGATSADLANDVEAGLAFLRAQPEVAPGRVGLLGHSEGGIIAPLVAARDPRVAFIVLMAAPAGKGVDALLSQQMAMSRQQGASEREMDYMRPLLRELLEEVRRHPDQEAARAAGRKLLARKRLPPMFGPEARELMIERLTSDWIRYLLNHDASAVLAQVRCPILAINGGKDLQVPLSHLDEIKRAAGASRSVTVLPLPELNHLFQHARSGSPGEYAEIEETFAPAALDAIGTWLDQQALQATRNSPG